MNQTLLECVLISKGGSALKEQRVILPTPSVFRGWEVVSLLTGREHGGDPEVCRSHRKG